MKIRRRPLPVPPPDQVPAQAQSPAPQRPGSRPGSRPGPRGWAGRGRGQASYLQAPVEYRGTSVQVCGLWPWAAGTGVPMVGVPLGKHTAGGGSVCCDPISWFQRARLISNPSEFVLGLPGLGKSSLVRRQVLGLAGYGVQPLILGDLKPDYVALIEALGGQRIPLGLGRGHLNVLDPGEARAAAARLTGNARAEVLADARGRRATVVSALITILRSSPPSDREETVISRGLQVLDDKHEGIPVLPDLLRVIREAPDDVRQVAIDRGSIERYRQITEALEATLVGMCGGGRFGSIFAEQTTTPMRRDSPVVFDVSSIDDGQSDLQAAALLACWSAGFGTVNVANALADAHLEPRRHYFVVMDELWRALRSGRGMVDRVDALTRLNRNRGVGQAMITHTLSDLTLPDPADTAKAKGFVERSGMVICGGLPRGELAKLRDVVPYSRAEGDLLASWTDPPAWDSAAGAPAAPPGQGNFLIKVGGRPGIPVHVDLTGVESAVNDTNRLWHEVSRIGRVSDLPPVDDVLDAQDAVVPGAPVQSTGSGG